MEQYYGPGDVHAVLLGGARIASTLTSLTGTDKAAIVDSTGLGQEVEAHHADRCPHGGTDAVRLAP